MGNIHTYLYNSDESFDESDVVKQLKTKIKNLEDENKALANANDFMKKMLEIDNNMILKLENKVNDLEKDDCIICKFLKND